MNKKPNIIVFSQDEGVFLSEAIASLVRKLNDFATVKCIVLLPSSPLGKNKSLFERIYTMLSIFGIKFVAYYGLKTVLSSLNKKNVFKLLELEGVEIKRIHDNINNRQNISLFKSKSPDIIVSLTCNQIFKRELLNLPTWGCINLHTAILPKYRGLLPSFWVMKNNEKYTGVSVFKMNEGIDDGPIIEQRKIKTRNFTQEKLIKLTKRIGVAAIVSAVKKICFDSVEYIENDARKATYYQFPTKRDVKEFCASGKRFF